MEKTIKYQIEMAKQADVDSVTTSTITMKAGKTVSTIKIFETNLIESEKKQGNNRFVEQQLTLRDIITTQIINSLKYPHIIKLFFADGTERVWGTMDNPVMLADVSVKNGGAELLLKRNVVDYEIFA